MGGDGSSQNGAGTSLGPSPLLRVLRVLRAIYAALSCAFSQSSTSLRTMSFAKP